MKLELAVDMGELDRLAEAIEDFCERHEVPAPAALQLNLVLEELFTHVVSLGDAGADRFTGTVHVAFDAQPEAVAVEIWDEGKPFDPLAAAAPDLDLDVEDRPIGGLGVHFLRTMMTDLRYSRANERNVVTFRKVWTN